MKKIKKVSYYLHPTFKPNILNSTNSDNNFTLSFTNWGIFTIKAKVFFNNSEVKDMEMSNREWFKILSKNGRVL